MSFATMLLCEQAPRTSRFRSRPGGSDDASHRKRADPPFAQLSAAATSEGCNRLFGNALDAIPQSAALGYESLKGSMRRSPVISFFKTQIRHAFSLLCARKRTDALKAWRSIALREQRSLLPIALCAQKVQELRRRARAKPTLAPRDDSRRRVREPVTLTYTTLRHG